MRIYVVQICENKFICLFNSSVVRFSNFLRCFSDLSLVVNLKEVVLHSFSALSEEVKSAASYALGSISIGNLQQYLPFILKEIEEQPRRQYLLLHSLKEVVITKNNSSVSWTIA